mmetsp:Transcript_3404/g.8110  ORF Transcript_3404/g.8110 Transcript_3404/m.8110 type:complete len:311 (-) Transcript_3404:150-1082(-)
MPIQIPAALYGIGGSIQFNLIGFHDLLDGLSNIAQSHVDSGLFDSLVGCTLDGFQQGIVAGIEAHRKGRIDDPSLDLDTEIHLHDIVILQDSVVTRVGCVMGGNMIQRAARGKADSSFQTVFLNEFAVLVFQLSTKIGQLDSRFAQRLCIVSNLPVNLGTPPNLAIQVFLDAIPGSNLGRSLAVGLALQQVGLYLSLGIFPAFKQEFDGNCRFWGGLTVFHSEIRKGCILKTKVGRLFDGFLECLGTRAIASLFLFLLLLFALLLFGTSFSIGPIGIIVAILVVFLLLWFGRDLGIFGFGFVCHDFASRL